MGDRPHLSNEKELYDYYNIYSQSTESPTTASSASSPMISMVQNHSIMNWHTNNITHHDPVVNQHYFDYSPQQPQQNQYAIIHQQSQQQRRLQLQQQQLYQQELSYRNSTLFMQGSSSSYQDPYHHHSHNNTNYDYVQHHSSSNSHMAVLDTNYHLLHETNLYHNTHQSAHIPNNTEAPLNNTTSPQNIPLDVSIATTNKIVVHSKQHNNNSNNSKKKKLKLTTKKSSTIKERNESLSPKSTPLPSPVLPITKRKRGEGNSNSKNNSRRSSVVSYSNASPSGGQKLQKDEGELLLIKVKEEEEGVCYGVLKEGDVNQKAVDQLESELGFLRDECATILIMLDSLRNAFMTDIPASKNHNTTRKQDNNNLPLTGTINFMEENSSGTNTFTSTLTKKTNNITMPHHNNSTNDNNTTMAQNPEMEREMRIAYDDLMLQVRQLEKKVERLEKKSRNACIIKNQEVKKKKEEKLSQNYTTTHLNNTSPLSEEEDLVIDEDEADSFDPDNSSVTNKRKRKRSITLPVKMAAATNTTSKVKKKKNLSTTDNNKDLLL